jgi:hypothetical protein
MAREPRAPRAIRRKVIAMPVSRERRARLDRIADDMYGDRQTGVIHLDITSRLQRLGRRSDRRTVRRAALRSLLQMRADGPSATYVAHVAGVWMPQ